MRDILRGALAVPPLRVADVTFNTEKIEEKMKEAEEQGAGVLVFPELCLTGYTCGDLFLSPLLLEKAEDALSLLAAAVPAHMAVVVGAPLKVGGRLFDCAFLLSAGKILGAVPKTFPTLRECRCFSPARDLNTTLATVGCFTFPIGENLLFTAADGTVLGISFGSDEATPLPPSALLAMEGAEVILQPAAEHTLVAAKQSRKNALTDAAARYHTAILYAAAGKDESVAEGIFGGEGYMILNGTVEAQKDEAPAGDYLLLADMDLGRIRYDRLHDRGFLDAAAAYATGNVETVPLPFPLAVSDGEKLHLSRLPFIPDEESLRVARSLEIFELQAASLARRLTVTGGKLTLGISGGLDSTLAMLVAIRAMEKLHLPRTNIIAITMPCFGTSDETLKNARELMEKLGVTAREIPIRDAVLQHFKDIGHGEKDFSVTYENSQARERTQVLMDVANKEGGIVLGTGDLSELALGWCTYNGDHMSMYGVNADVPKTLVRWVIESVAKENLLPEATAVLLRILDTPISPELLPPDAVGKIAQKTEDIVGPYALHDFFLYYTVRYAYRPAKVFRLATLAFRDIFPADTVKKWLKVFTRRFFNQQFKRNCLPDGPKIGSVSLSSREDYQMPSDASSADFLREIDEIEG